MSRIKRWQTRGALGLLLLAGAAWYLWDSRGVIAPRGGLYFPWKKEISAPAFAQADPLWKEDRMGDSPGTLGAEGCAVTSAAMALASYGMTVDPKRLNQFLSRSQGYTPQGWIHWEVAAEFEPHKVRHAYEDLPSYRLMDWNLLRGNPVIVRIRPHGGRTHFVLIIGKEGLEYIAQDPGSDGRKVLLSAFESRIEALRFYRKL